jgi:ABC-type transport system involved in multi-copper enzyme maturation permease subunit
LGEQSPFKNPKVMESTSSKFAKGTLFFLFPSLLGILLVSLILHLSPGKNYHEILYDLGSYNGLIILLLIAGTLAFFLGFFSCFEESTVPKLSSLGIGMSFLVVQKIKDGSAVFDNGSTIYAIKILEDPKSLKYSRMYLTRDDISGETLDEGLYMKIGENEVASMVIVSNKEKEISKE